MVSDIIMDSRVRLFRAATNLGGVEEAPFGLLEVQFHRQHKQQLGLLNCVPRWLVNELSCIKRLSKTDHSCWGSPPQVPGSILTRGRKQIYTPWLACDYILQTGINAWWFWCTWLLSCEIYLKKHMHGLEP